MGNPNEPFPVPPEGAPTLGQPPQAGHPPQQPYSGQPYQPPYGAPPSSSNSKVLIGVIAGLVLVIVVGATLVLSGAFDGRSSRSTATNSTGTAMSQRDLDLITGQGNMAGRSSGGGSSSYSSNMAGSSYGGGSTGSGDLAVRVGDVAEAMHAQTPAQAGPLTIRNVRQVGGTNLEINSDIPRSMSPSEFPFLENDLRPNICASPAGALARQGANVTLYITESGGYRHPMRVSC